MARDAAGTYTAPSNSFNPAVAGTEISKTDWNSTLDDLEAALTDSLSVSGKGKITAYVDFDENAAPGTPSANVGRLYAADDGGITTLRFKDSAGAINSLSSFHTTPEKHGAVGDGVTNDYAAIAAAIAEAAAGNGLVLFRATYGTNTLVDVTDGVTLLGVGDAGLKALASMTALVQCGPTAGTTQESCRVIGLTLDGNSLTTSAVLSVRNIQLSEFRDLDIKNSSAVGMKTDTDTSNINTRCLRNVYDNIRSHANTSHGFYFIGEKDSRYDMIFSHDNGGKGVWWQGFNNASLQETTTCTVGSVLARDNTGDGVTFDGCEKFVVGNILSTINAGYGVRFLTTYDSAASIGQNNIQIANCICRNNDLGGLTNITDGVNDNGLVTDLSIGNLSIIGFGDIENVIGMKLYGVNRLRIANLSIIGMSCAGAYIGSGTVSGVPATQSGDIQIGTAKIIACGYPTSGGTPSSYYHGLYIDNSTSALRIGSLELDNNLTTGGNYELQIGGSVTDFEVANAVITSNSGSNGINGGANVIFTRLRLEGVSSGVGTTGALTQTISRSGTQMMQFTSTNVLANKPVGVAAGALTLANGANNNIALAGAEFARIAGPTGVFSVTGIVPSSSVAVRLHLYNSTAFDMTLANESASSTAANRILTGTGADVTLTAASSASMIYSPTDSRWILLGTQG